MTTEKKRIMPTPLQTDFVRCLLVAALASTPAYAQVQPQPQVETQLQVKPQPRVEAQAQTTSAEGLQAASAADSFYEQLGGKDGVAAIVAEFVNIMLADKRIADTFEGVDMDRLHAKLAEQFCMLSGGPCNYTGKSMQEVHEDLKVNNARFNASVEDLQNAMTRRGVSSRVQNRLLSKLAPTQRSIVTQ